VPIGFDLDAGSIPGFGDFFCNGDYAAATTNADRGDVPLHFYVYVWSVVTGNDLRILDVAGDNGIGTFCYITDENELIVRDGGFVGSPTHMLVYNAADFSLLQTIAIAPYLTDADMNSGFTISEVTVGGDKYLFVQVAPYIAFRGPYLVLKRISGAWSVINNFNSDGTTISGYSGISAGTQYAYLRGSATIGRVQWNGGYSEALISPPGLGSRHILYVQYLPATDEVLVITGTNADATVDALVYSPDLSTLIRSATIYSSFSAGIRNADGRLFLTDYTRVAVPIVDVSTAHITQILLFDPVTLTVSRTVPVHPDGDFVNQNNPYNYAVFNSDHVGVGVMPAGSPQHLSFWPLSEPISADIGVALGIGISLSSFSDVCPVEGVGSDNCIVGQSSLPMLICGREQALERTCDIQATVSLPIGVEVSIQSMPAYIYVAIRTTLQYAKLDDANIAAFEEPDPDHNGPTSLPPNYGYNTYYAGLRYRYPSNNPLFIKGHVYTGAFVYDAIAGTWTSVPTEDFTVTGMPDNPVNPWYMMEDIYTPSLGQFTDQPITHDETMVADDMSHWYVEPDTPDLGISVPFHPLFFKEGPLSLQVRAHHKVFPGVEPTDKVVLGDVPLARWYYRHYPLVITEVLAAWPPVDVTVDYNGTTFELYGTKSVLSGDTTDFYQVKLEGSRAGEWANNASVIALFRALDPGTRVSVQLGIGIAATGLSGEPPAGPAWSLDFMSEVYTNNGTPVAIATIIDKPARVGASGLEILDHDPDGAVQALGDLFDDLALLNWTIVIEWQELTTSGRTHLLGMFEDTNNDELLIERTNVEDVQAYGWGSAFRGVLNSGTGDQYGTGFHKTAVTYTDTKISISTDGSAVETDTTANTMNPMQVAYFGGRGEAASVNPTFLLTVTLTEPVTDAELPGLST
jgi:hypothetical protein